MLTLAYVVGISVVALAVIGVTTLAVVLTIPVRYLKRFNH